MTFLAAGLAGAATLTVAGLRALLRGAAAATAEAVTLGDLGAAGFLTPWLDDLTGVAGVGLVVEAAAGAAAAAVVVAVLALAIDDDDSGMGKMRLCSVGGFFFAFCFSFFVGFWLW